jgi:hypothetical protein
MTRVVQLPIVGVDIFIRNPACTKPVPLPGTDLDCASAKGLAYTCHSEAPSDLTAELGATTAHYRRTSDAQSVDQHEERGAPSLLVIVTHPDS